MTYISVIIPTTRIGGLDVLFAGLQQQTFKDFELVLVDSLYNRRKDIVSEQAVKYSFPVKHVLQRQNTASSYCAAMNTGVINASGQIIFCICDYAWLYPDCLQIHANFHQSNKSYGLICSYNVCKLPKLHKNFYRSYGGHIPYDTEHNRKRFIAQERENHDSYIEDINSGKLDSLMWSIFDDPFSSNATRSLELIATKDPYPEGNVGVDCCYLKNESYELDNVLDINGFNEVLDGSHGWQDWEFAERFIANGSKLYYKPHMTATVVDPRSVLFGRLRERDVFSNEAIWKSAKGSNKPVNNWSLKEARKL